VSDSDTFMRFRRKLEDAVLVAINSGRRVTSERYRLEPDSCCPIGCLSIAGAAYPPAGNLRYAMPQLEFPPMAPTAFANGFDGHKFDSTWPSNRPYYELGKLYRARFP
jgi:hypothetical protein